MNICFHSFLKIGEPNRFHFCETYCAERVAGSRAIALNALVTAVPETEGAVHPNWPDNTLHVYLGSWSRKN